MQQKNYIDVERAWAYKWYKRYNEKGLDGLKDKERSEVVDHQIYPKKQW